MKIKIEGRYKAVKDIEFEFSEGLTLITGYNGAGKSQLLQLINTAVSKTTNPNNHHTYSPNGAEYSVQIENFSIQEAGANVLWVENYGQVVFQKNILYKDFKEACLEVYSIIRPDQKNHILNTLGRNKNTGNQPEIITNSQLRQIIQSLSGKLISEIERTSNKTKEELLPADILGNFPVHILVTELQPSQTDQILSFYFYCHQYKVAYNAKHGIEVELGEAPWDILQRVIDSLGFNYKVASPDINKLNDILDTELNEMSEKPFQIILLDNDSGTEIIFQNLSSGERQLFSIGMLRYSTELRNNKRKLILLDEPDAHLHPSMITQFFKIVNEFLVKENGIKVIMTTHSASTLALASKYENLELFFMKRSSEFEPTKLEVDNSPKFSRSIKSLSNGLFAIYPETRFIVVEDQDDVDFYNCITEFSSNEKCSMLNFIASSELTENGEGGKVAVEKSLSYLQRFDGLTIGNSSVIGLIDKDTGNFDFDENDLISLIGRYSIENYWFDPLIVYCILLNGNNADFENVNVLGIKPGEEFTIRKKSSLEIQKQVDKIVEKLHQQIVFDETVDTFQFNNEAKVLTSPLHFKELSKVKYLNDHEINIPKWLINVRGKDLRQIYQVTFGNVRALTNESAYKYFRSSLHIPKELLTQIESCISI